MLHQTINIDPQIFWEKYTNIGVEDMHGRFLVRRNRLENMSQYLLSLARAYKTAQRQYENWRETVWIPLFEEIQALAVDGVVKFHAKPTHQYQMYENRNWWEYTLRKGEKPYGWGYSFDWIDEPKEKLHHSLGQKFYSLDKYQSKFSNRTCILSKILKQYLLDFVYKKYDYQWLHDNQFSEKLVKIELLGDEYWFRIGRGRRGGVVWENFIWQNNQTETIKIS